MKRELPQAGEVFEMAYPFVRDTFCALEDDGGGCMAVERACWKPGVRTVNIHHGTDYEAVADGIGKQTLTVVGTFKPGRFPCRVFFTRKWTDPDGKTFGKGACKITTLSAFRLLINGYRHPFEFGGKTYGTRPDPYGETTEEMITALIQKAAAKETEVRR